MQANSSTLRQALSDLRWEQAQGRETSFIAAQEAAKEKARVFAASVAAVASRYTFTPSYDLFRFTREGVCTQAAMTLTEDGDTLTVIAKIEDSEEAWFIADASRLHFAPAVYIHAVQNRVAENKAAKEAGR